MNSNVLNGGIRFRTGCPIAIAAIVLVAAFVLMCTGFADDSDAAGGIIPNTNITWETKGDTLTVTGPAGGQAMPEYDENPNQPWSMDGIKKIVIGDGITRVGRSTFENCSGVEQISFGKDLSEIGDSAFSNTGITELTLPGNVTTLEQLAFGYCKSLKTAQLGDGLQNIGFFAFMGCENMESVNIPASVTTIDDDAFTDCLHLHHVDWYASFTKSKSDHVFTYSATDPDGFSMYCGPGSVMTDGILTAAIVNELVFDGKEIRSNAFDKNSCFDLNIIVFGDNLESIAGDAFGDYTFHDEKGSAIDPTVDNLKGKTFVAKGWHNFYPEKYTVDDVEDDESLKNMEIALAVCVAVIAFGLVISFARRK